MDFGGSFPVICLYGRLSSFSGLTATTHNNNILYQASYNISLFLTIFIQRVLGTPAATLQESNGLMLDSF